MSRYIDADKLMDQLNRKKPEVGKIRFVDGYNDAIMRVISMVHSAPTADVVEIRHGYWYIVETEYLNCSECGGEYYTGAESRAEAKERLAEGRYYPFCPHCGAKMDGERREG